MHSFIFQPVDEVLQKWKTEYGDIMTVWLGTVPAVSVNTAQLILDTFVKNSDAYAGRPIMEWNEIVRGGSFGIINSQGQLWRENRRFALQTLRNFGLGRNLMQERVLDDVIGLIEHLKMEIETQKNEFNLSDEIDLAVGSIINSVMFGYRFSRNNRAEFDKVKKIAVDAVSFKVWPTYRMMEGSIGVYRKLPIFKATYETIVAHAKEAKTFFNGQIEKHLKEINSSKSTDECSDFVEAFLRHKHKLDENEEKHNFNDDQLFATILDIWIAGQGTTSTTLSWLFLYIIQNADVQSKAQNELDSVIGSDRIITLNDKANLHYINAIVAETQRCCNLVALNVPHTTTRDVTIHGYTIPAGMTIMNQISTVLHDEHCFPDPKEFKPERFINCEGKLFQPMELMPFSVGKRACLGEGLARVELFLFAANLLNQFKFEEHMGKPVSGKRFVRGITSPEDWICKITLRE
uniref:Unspecific monooxygenase n=1 Tax=Panagrellus redivivus TaxID=6233 RepID=A0A7E4VN01_PANRE